MSQILSFSRQTSRKRSLICFASVVEEVLHLVRTSLPATIEIHYEPEDEAGTIFADMTEAHQVVMNLCANAGMPCERMAVCWTCIFPVSMWRGSSRIGIRESLPASS